MKCNPLRWLAIGVPLIAVLSGIASVAIREGVQEDLKRRVEARLKEAELGWARADFDGRDLMISGKAEADDEPNQAAIISDQVRGVRVVNVNAELLPLVDPYDWTATLASDDRLVLGGHVPSQKVRKQVIAASKSALPRAQIDDKMELGRGNQALPDWQGATTFALKQLAQLKSGRASLSNMSLSVEGEARNTASYRDVKSALSGGLPKNAKLGADKVTPPLIDPYSWTAKLADNKVTLTGYVPSESMRAEILATAQKAFGKTPVVDRMEPGAGAPKDWAKAFVVALDQLATLQDGIADLKGNQLTLSGNAIDDGVADATRKAFKSKVPSSFKTAEAIKGLGPVLPRIDPYVMRVEATAGGPVEVGGYVPSEAARDAVLKAVKAKFQGRQVTDRLQLGVGEPQGFDQCLLAAVAGLSKLGNGKVTMSGKSVELAGVTEDEALALSLPSYVQTGAKGACETKVNVRYDDTKRREAAKAKAEAEAADAARKAAEEQARIAAEAAKAKEQARLAEELNARKQAASACETALRSANATGTIQFERASDVILPSSRGVLRRLVEVAKTCQSSMIQVEGHTDSEGIPERNQPLSERRAGSVRNFLVEAGVPAERITAVGYGDSKPIADNATAEGRAQNRRIEFTVKAN